MSKKGKILIIVESPTKIKTLKKFLGPNYIFESSVGHIRDLPEKEFGIDFENEFEPKYVTMTNKEKVIASLKKAAKGCDTVYLAPDPDREGEAIAWHIVEILPPNIDVQRVSFNSITKDEVQRALDHPRAIDKALVNAQQARRLLDRIVGYKISPILNRRIQRGKDGGVSAGRVQSVALKLVVDREKEIEAFKPVEYWNIGAILAPLEKETTFQASLYAVDEKRVEKEAVEGKDFTIINNKEAADKILSRMKDVPYTVTRVDKKEKKRHPVPPFITSTLQQEASRHHSFSSARTMGVAQGLYEGVDLGKDGSEGLITYMRTDSVRVAPEALGAARGYIKDKYGKQFLPEKPRQYSTKKSAQDAHEAIRPANLSLPPEKLQKYLTREQFLLYSLIWKRFIASQMVPAIYDTVSCDIMANDAITLRTTGSIIKFQGFLAVYEEKEDEASGVNEDKKLPNLTEGELLKLESLTSEQSFTRPPPRFSEASLVKELEKSGIGRPSTYTSIMNKIQSRAYTVKEQARLKPTELGRVVAEMLETNFSLIMNIDFTARMEDDLESVATNGKDWKLLLKDFWKDFEPTLKEAEESAFVPKVETDLSCPKCQAKLQKIWYKSGYFYGCSNYPDCDYSSTTAEMDFNKEDYAEDFDWDQKCPQCQEDMILRHGKFGPFLGCTKYPDCKGIINIPKKGEEVIPASEMPSCPAIDCPGQLVARKSRFGKTFYSCSTFPECDVIVNDFEQLSTKYPAHPRTAYVKKTKKGKATAKKSTKKKTTKAKSTKKTTPRVVPPSPLSPEMSTFLGVKELPRGQVVKGVWEYIKTHSLQDSKDKRMIVPDTALGKILGSKDPVSMFKMTALISKHILTKPKES